MLVKSQSLVEETKTQSISKLVIYVALTMSDTSYSESSAYMISLDSFYNLLR